MFYPPKGAAKAEPVWGPIVFTYILFILGSRSRKGTWKGDFPRENKTTKMFYPPKGAAKAEPVWGRGVARRHNVGFLSRQFGNLGS